eukprot:g606.t1
MHGCMNNVDDAQMNEVKFYGMNINIGEETAGESEADTDNDLTPLLLDDSNINSANPSKNSKIAIMQLYFLESILMEAQHEYMSHFDSLVFVDFATALDPYNFAKVMQKIVESDAKYAGLPANRMGITSQESSITDGMPEDLVSDIASTVNSDADLSVCASGAPVILSSTFLMEETTPTDWRNCHKVLKPNLDSLGLLGHCIISNFSAQCNDGISLFEKKTIEDRFHLVKDASSNILKSQDLDILVRMAGRSAGASFYPLPNTLQYWIFLQEIMQNRKIHLQEQDSLNVCKQLFKEGHVIPNVTWGKLTPPQQSVWSTLRCDQKLELVLKYCTKISMKIHGSFRRQGMSHTSKMQHLFVWKKLECAKKFPKLIQKRSLLP